MHPIHLTLAAACAVLASAALAPRAQAADLQSTPRLHMTPSLPSLGPVGDGRRKYVEFGCYLCHGNNGAGQIGPNIQHAEARDLNEAVKAGVPEFGMPAYGSAASAADITNLGAYLASIGTAKEPKWWDWWVPNPTQ